MAVLSRSKQEFSRLDVLLRDQSGRLRVADACELNHSSPTKFRSQVTAVTLHRSFPP